MRWLSLIVGVILIISMEILADLDELFARIFVYKSSSTNPVVEGKTFNIIYQLINTGDASANQVEIVDRYDPKSFELLDNINEDGTVTFHLDELVPGAQASFNVSVKPKLFGLYDSTRARIKYISGMVEMDGVDPDVRQGYSTSLGRLRIVSAAEYTRTTSYYLKEWLLYAMISSCTICIPLYLWLQTKSVIENVSTLRKQI